MKKYIYKITNKITTKVYIGQTINYIERWENHIRALNNNNHDNYYLQNAWNKYGENAFSFEVLGTYDNYNEMEIYYIKKYNSTDSTYGYNILKGGDEPPILEKENSHFANHTQQEIDNLKYDLINSKLSHDELSIKYNYSLCSLSRINYGVIWYEDEYTYPLRNYTLNLIDVDCIIDLLKNTTLTQTEIANKFNVSRTTITAINRGQNFYNSNIKYPIREHGRNIRTKLQDMCILKYILNNQYKSFTEIAKDLNVIVETVYDVNKGRRRYEGYIYPIRQTK